MPFAFPSHQGFIAPLWRHWPYRFDAPALCIGAAMPDVVDGIAGAFRGGLGQWYGHTLVGLVLIIVPFGVFLTWCLGSLGSLFHGPGRPARAARWFYTSSLWHDDKTGFERLWNTSESMCIGGFSHLFFDLISHGSFLWFYPWYTNARFFPHWWYTKWFEIPLPFYRQPYTAGPHLLVWAILSVVGAVMLVWPWMTPRSKR